MQCSCPTIAYRLPGINPQTGKHYPPQSFRDFFKIFGGQLSITGLDRRVQIMTDYYNACPEGYEAVLMPCKRCLNCTRNYRRSWSMRLCHEASTCGDSMFLTLTVDDRYLDDVFPKRPGSVFNSLDHRPFQLFFKRLRKLFDKGFSYKYYPPYTSNKLLPVLPRNVETRFYQAKKIKYYMCGEYGDNTHRPHYHACIFGARFPDALFAKKKNGVAYYSSEILKSLWPYGEMSLFSDVNPRSAAYVAGYVDKKLDTDRRFYDDVGVMPEYVRMSQGLGLDYLKEHCDDMYRFTSDGKYFDEAFFNGDFRSAAPSYYDEKFRLLRPERYDILVSSRESRTLERRRLIHVDEALNVAGRVHAVRLARKPVRESAGEYLTCIMRQS